MTALSEPAPAELSVLLDGLTQGGLSNSVSHGVWVHGLAGHSDEVRARDLFVALRGRCFDGFDFIPEAATRCAVAAVCDADASAAVADMEAAAGIQVVAVSDLAHKSGVIADRFYGHPSAQIQVIAVTGTNGKTSVAHFVAEALHLERGTCGLIGTLGCGVFGELRESGMTTPGAIRLHREINALRMRGAGVVVIEASSHGLDQGRLSGVDVNVAVFTNLGRDHLDYHASGADYAAAKEKLFARGATEHAVINIGDPFGRALVQRCRSHCEVTTYALDAPADLSATVLAGTHGLEITVRARGVTVGFLSSLFGRFNAANLLAAFAVLLTQGISPERAASLLARARPVRGRMQRITGGGRCAVVDYAHTPEALENFLVACREITMGRLVCVFGCGGDRDRGKRTLMGEVASRLADAVVISDDNPRSEDPTRIVADIQSGVISGTQVEVIHDRARAIRHALSFATHDDCIAVAGKGHESFQIVGSQHLPFNDADVVQRALGKTAS